MPVPDQNLAPAVQAALDAASDDELREAEDICTLVGIPAEYAGNLAVAIAACLPGGTP
jgi:hypothetical protein